MKKKISLALVLLLILANIVAMTSTVFAEEVATEEETITISYMCTQDTVSDTTILDKIAHPDGKQTVAKGEKFTLPTTAGTESYGKYTEIPYVNQEGFQVVWYTENGRTYKGGETVSFDEDTKLFRCVAKECYTMAEVNYAMCNESKAAILMADINTSDAISVENQGQSALILNGFTINISKNSSNLMGSQRSGKHIYGEGTINANNPDGKVGSYSFFHDQSHGYNGSANKTVVGVDVTINAPNYWLGGDGDGSYNNHYPWTRIYGTVNFYGLYSVGNINNRAPMVEVFEGANVTITGPKLFVDNTWRANNKYSFNTQAFELRIYGGTFNLPAEATTEEFWTNDNVQDYVVNEKDYYYNYGLTKNTKDSIKIFGGSFVLPDNAVPAIADYLTNDWIGSIPSGGNGLVSNSNTSTYHVAYMNRPGYKLAFEKYTIADGAYGKLTVTDDIDGTLSGTYYYQMTQGTIVFTDPYNSSEVTQNTISEIIVYEASEVTGDDGATTTVYTVTDKFELGFGMGGTVLFKNNITTADNKLQNLEANSTIFQVVVPADCEHTFTGEPLEATCEHGAYADYNCSVCGHNVYFSWGEKLDHNYVLGEHTEATATTLGSKSYECSFCGDAKTRAYSLDPTNLEIAVTIKNDDGTFEEITVLASEIFEFATSGADGDYIYTLSGIKTFGDYKIRNIYGITIPQGILYVNIATHNYEKYNNVECGLVLLTIDEGANVDLLNIGNLRWIEKIVIKENANVVFGSSCSYYSPNNERRSTQRLTTIDLSAGNHSVKFMSGAFNDRATVAELIFGENSIYDFAYQAFRNCAITEFNFPVSNEYIFGSECFVGNDMTELVFPDNFDMTLSSTMFYNCPNLTSVTFGENSTYIIGSNCFRYSPIPKVVFAPNSTYTIGSQAFMNSTLTEVDASAGNMNITFNNSAFNCWMDNKLYCTLSTLKLGENSTYHFADSSFANSSIEKLVLAGNSTYTFVQYCFNGDTTKALLSEIDMSAEGITATFNWRSFYQRTALTSIIFGEKGNYTFNGGTFEGTPIGDITLAPNSTYVFNSGWINSSSTITKLDASASGIDVKFNEKAFDSRTTLETLLINGENSTYYIGNYSFKKTIIKDLTLGEGSTYTFGYKCFDESTAIASIDASASNLNVTFKNEAFTNRTSLTSLKLGENSTYSIEKSAFNNTNLADDIVFASNSTFTIGEKAFYSTAFTSITFEDNCNVTFTGTNAFQDNDQATSLYIGKNIAIKNYPFKNLKALETLYIMEGVTHANEWEFEYAGAADYTTPIYVYNHSYDLTFTKGMFNECDGIVLYTVTDNIGTSGELFRGCADVTDSSGNVLYKAWTVYLGIPHPVVEGLISNPTCTEEGITGWVSDTNYCNCGFKITETMVVNKYENVHNIKDTTTPVDTATYEVAIAPAWGHDYGVESPVRIDWIYVDLNYFANAKNKHNCTVCGEDYLGEDIENSALFTAKGITFAEDVKDAIGHAISVNLEAVLAYNEFLGAENAIKYGVVAGLASEDGKPVTSAGKANGKAVVAGFENTKYSILQLKITNISDANQGLYCSAYIIVDDTVTYLHNGEVSDTATEVSLNYPDGVVEETVENIQVEAVVDNKETIYA